MFWLTLMEKIEIAVLKIENIIISISSYKQGERAAICSYFLYFMNGVTFYNILLTCWFISLKFLAASHVKLVSEIAYKVLH